MIGGYKTISRVALVAAAGVIAGSVSAKAADLGGNCCADLEERVAELEATTVRKGNRRVSLEVSGHVNEAMFFWSGDQADTLRDSGVDIATNNNSRTRFRFKGAARISADWSAGFLLEIGVRQTNNSGAGAGGLQGGDANQKLGMDVRHEALYLQSRTFGTIWLGHTGSSTEGITEICLGCGSTQGMDSGTMLGGFMPLGGGGATWSSLASSTRAQFSSGEGDRRDIIMYQTPSLWGFIVSAAYGSDEFYDVALRYAGEFYGFRLAAGVGYQNSNEQGSTFNALAAAGSTAAKGFAAGCRTGADGRVDCDAIGASASLMHVPTGLYIAGAYGVTRDNSVASVEEDKSWYITGGINRRFMALGATNFYGEYGRARSEIGYGVANVGFGSEVEWYGGGVEQNIDAAAMSVYLAYKHYEGNAFNAAAKTGPAVSDLDMIILGAKISF